MSHAFVRLLHYSVGSTGVIPRGGPRVLNSDQVVMLTGSGVSRTEALVGRLQVGEI